MIYNLNSMCVTYWPSTEPLIKRCICVNKRKNSETGASGRRYRNITLNCGHGWIRGRCICPHMVSDNYITRCHRRLGLVTVQFQSVPVPVAVGVSWGQDASVRASGRQRALGPQWPIVEQPSQDAKDVLLWSEELWVNMSPSPTYLSHTTNINPFENKVWEIIFL